MIQEVCPVFDVDQDFVAVGRQVEQVEPVPPSLRVGSQLPDGRRVREPRRLTVRLPRRVSGATVARVKERAYEGDLERAVARISRCNTVAVIGPQGGAGKTRVAYMLGACLAWHARLNVVVVDVDDDYGALPDLVPEGMRVRSTLADLLMQNEDVSAPLPFSRLRRFLSGTPSGMSVLSGGLPREMRQLRTVDFDRLLLLLAGADVVVLDCAAGTVRERSAWAIRRSDQRVVVARSEMIGATMTVHALRDEQLDARTWLVLNRVGARTEMLPIRRVFESAGLPDPVEVPESSVLAAGLADGSWRLENMPGPVRLPVKLLAAMVAGELD